MTKLSLSRLITVDSFLSVRAVVDSRKGVNRDLWYINGHKNVYPTLLANKGLFMGAVVVVPLPFKTSIICHFSALLFCSIWWSSDPVFKSKFSFIYPFKFPTWCSVPTKRTKRKKGECRRKTCSRSDAFLWNKRQKKSLISQALSYVVGTITRYLI